MPMLIQVPMFIGISEYSHAYNYSGAYVYLEVNSKYLDLLFKALKTVKPISVEAERAFSAMGFLL